MIANTDRLERNHDETHNGGGEGYNPYRQEREEREAAALADLPRTRHDIIHELGVLDCSIARESGTYDAKRIAALRAERDAMDRAVADAFTAEWTATVTRERRKAWNARVMAGEIKDSASAHEAMVAQGWTMADLKKAIKLYSL